VQEQPSAKLTGGVTAAATKTPASSDAAWSAGNDLYLNIIPVNLLQIFRIRVMNREVGNDVEKNSL